ncbi:MAG: FG-GAP and VCBS repeat-containing protein, partial [Planctomycetota bacterium]|nr:FG-GAP and VCBS repeat-containing protein [Planctomycetota bacterium]
MEKTKQNPKTSRLQSSTFLFFNLPAVLCMVVLGCGSWKESGNKSTQSKIDPYFLKRNLSEESTQQVEKFCSACHDLPKANNFPIDAWAHEVKQGFDFYDQSSRTDLDRPNYYDAIAYFTQKAPERELFLRATESTQAQQQLKSGFQLMKFSPDQKNNSVANVEFIKADVPGFVACDMQDGFVSFYPAMQPDNARKLHQTSAPINSTICDLDQNGQTDIMISDIGDYNASDSQMGKIIWLQKHENEFKPIEIAANLGRVCQTIVNDFNGDGFNDILVAEFGYFKTGSIFLLKNDGQGFSKNNF